MPFDRTWGILFEPIRGPLGIYYEVSSPKGKATIRREANGWAIRGDQKLRRTDARPIVPKEDDKEYDWAVGVPDASYYNPYDQQEVGPFVVEGLRNYAAARQHAYWRLALMPARVPFSALDHGTAEANRDKQFLCEQIRAFQIQNPYDRMEEPEEFYRQIVEMEAEQKNRRRRRRQ